MRDQDVIYEYSLSQAIADGFLAEVFKNRWKKLSGGKPIVATAKLFQDVSLAGLMEIWNEFLDWRTNVLPCLPEEEQLFHTRMNDKTVWMLEDAQTFTLLYPDEY